MKKIVYFVIASLFIASISSCATAVSVKQNTNKVAGYTLKNKKELMQQKILNTKKKSIVATP